MDVIKTKNITNSKQFERLVSLMEKNAFLAKGFFAFGSTKEIFFESWNTFAIELNSLGPPVREGSGWQKVWSDLKNKIKKKLEHNKKEKSSTSGGTNKVYIFSQLEERVISLLTQEKTSSVENNNREPSSSNKEQILNIQEQTTFSNFTNESVHQPEADDISISNSIHEINQQTPPRIKRRASSISTNFEEEKKLLLHESKTKCIEEQTKHIKECARFKRKLYELSEKKFKIWSEIQNEKLRYRQNKMDYKLRELQYKERKLALKENRDARRRLATISQTFQPSHFSSSSSE